MGTSQSARNRARNRRKDQKSKRRKRLLILGIFVGVATLVAAALFPDLSLTGSATPELPASVNKAPAAVGQKGASALAAPKASSLQESQSQLAKELSLETKEKKRDTEARVGFGLEDLIQKTRSSKEVKTPKKSSRSKENRPLLVVIIDDISQPGQLRQIRKIPYPVTPSIFPPSSMSTRTPRMARGLKHYMVHLPLESSSARMNRFTKTLFTGDSYGRIDSRLRELRRLFPSARFLNNHTGSRFTSDSAAMKRLFKAMKKEGWIFLDSRTSGRSKGKQMARRYGQPYLHRDVFIDNVRTPSAILAQLKKAVRIAKRRGYAIAIGHPHPETFRALRSAGKILSGVRVVYLDELYRLRFGGGR